ncbi:VOC family protein [Demequina sp. NBRC 110051]|uniref:VOC family protein n=1 Tax=Demequina sp. NBRC 110051 TaxID=1570340 RepID=UPI000A033732|nr:VOC family protein [Demequina sp. NBRC 110051]
MLTDSPAVATFSVDSAATAAEFYRDVLGLDVRLDDEPGPMLHVAFAGGGRAMIYEKEGHQAASHTVLMFPVDDVVATAGELVQRGVVLERLEWCDPDGIARDPDGAMPDMAWFKDPAGNWLHLIGPTP